MHKYDHVIYTYVSGQLHKPTRTRTTILKHAIVYTYNVKNFHDTSNFGV